MPSERPSRVPTRPIPDQRQSARSFDLLGFTHFWARSTLKGDIANIDNCKIQLPLGQPSIFAMSPFSGREWLNEFKDPFGTGPFEFRPLHHAFELRSKLLFRDQPVSLTVGQRKNWQAGRQDVLECRPD